MSKSQKGTHIIRSPQGTDYTRHFEIDFVAFRAEVVRRYKYGDTARFGRELGLPGNAITRVRLGYRNHITRRIALAICTFYNMPMEDFIRCKI